MRNTSYIKNLILTQPEVNESNISQNILLGAIEITYTFGAYNYCLIINN